MDTGIGNPIAGEHITNVLTRTRRIWTRRQKVVNVDQPALIVEGVGEVTGLLLSGRNGG